MVAHNSGSSDSPLPSRRTP